MILKFEKREKSSNPGRSCQNEYKSTVLPSAPPELTTIDSLLVLEMIFQARQMHANNAKNSIFQASPCIVDAF